MHNDFVYSSQIEGGPKGLVNLGSTCYMNSVIQCLQSCDVLKNFISGKMLETYVAPKIIYQGLICQGLQNIFQVLENTHSNEPFMPQSFLGVVSACWSAFEAGRQMDAAEFLSFLLSALHDDLIIIRPHIQNSVWTGDINIDAVTAWEHSSQSAISHIFNVQVIGWNWCLQCPFSSGQYDDISNMISVEVIEGKFVSLEDCMQHYFNEEDLMDAKCGSCSSKGLKHKLILGRLPPVLIVHLKRFKRLTNGSFQKITKTVNFSTCLDLKPFCVTSVHSSKYELKSVVNHHENSLSSGHYTALSKRGDRWYNFNDSKVSSSTTRHLCTSNAYLLFYEMQSDDNNNHLPSDFAQASLETFLKNFVSSDPKVTNDKPDVSQDLFDDDDEEEEEEGELPPAADGYNLSDHDSDKSCDQSFNLEYLAINDTPANNDVDVSGASNNYEDNECDNATDVILDNNGNISGFSQKIDGVTDSLTSNVISQCNHPNFDLDVMDPVLTVKDVPGAKLDLDNLGKYNVNELKWWLACRRLPQKGKKPQLQERILNHRQREGKIYPGVGKGKWYEAKRKKAMAAAYDSNKRYPMFPTGAVWKPFPSVHIPKKYSTDMALKYLTAIPLWRFSPDHGVTIIDKKDEDNGSENEDDLFDLTPQTQDERRNIFVKGTMKRATNFLDSGRVLTVHDCEKDKHYCVKAEVQASMRKATYMVCIMISKSQGAICFAECCCKARALGRCCHIFAVLLLISRHIERHGNEAVTSTGRRCYWLLPGTTVVRTPGVVRDKTEYYPKVKYYRRGHFDPRPTEYQTDDDSDRITKFLNQLQSLPTAILWSYHLLHPHPSTTLDEEEIFPDLSTTLTVAEMCSYMLWNLNLIKGLSIFQQPLHLPLTTHQSSSPAWAFERAVRIPASKAQKMLGLQSSRSTVNGKINALRKHIWGLEPFQNQAMREGLQKEPAARKAYTIEIKKTHPEWDVIETGMWVSPKHPQLSCSPDGIVVDVNGFVKLLEVKCPAVLKEMDPADFETLPIAQARNFCLFRNKTNGQVEVRRSHHWYVQVQMSLDILQLTQCDFVVYSEKKNKPKILIVPVLYSEDFWKEKRERLKRIHRELIVPEFFLYNTIFKRQPKFLVYSQFHEDYDDNYFWYGEEPSNTFTVENENEVLISSKRVQVGARQVKSEH